MLSKGPIPISARLVLHRTPCKKLSLRSQCVHWLWQSAPPAPHLLLCFRRGRYPCCGAQKFCAAPRRTLVILNAATRSFCFFRHRRRWICVPHRPVSYALPHPTPVGATLAVAHPGSHRTYCHTPVGRGALTPPPSSHCVIAKPVRTLAVAIYAPCTALPSLRKGHSPPPAPQKCGEAPMVSPHEGWFTIFCSF